MLPCNRCNGLTTLFIPYVASLMLGLTTLYNLSVSHGLVDTWKGLRGSDESFQMTRRNAGWGQHFVLGRASAP